MKSTFPDFPSQMKKVQRNVVSSNWEKKTLPFIMLHYRCLKTSLPWTLEMVDR